MTVGDLREFLKDIRDDVELEVMQEDDTDSASIDTIVIMYSVEEDFNAASVILRY